MRHRITNKVILTEEDLKPISSSYLQEGRKLEDWVIQRVELQQVGLQAQLAMKNYAVSATDGGGFHLTIFSTLEFTSQLMIVYAHYWAGLERKVREGWMVESQTRSIRAIRNPDAIQVEMRVEKMRQQGEHLYCIADYVISDNLGGRFEVRLKGFLS
jgi:hypothetical protein